MKTKSDVVRTGTTGIEQQQKTSGAASTTKIQKSNGKSTQRGDLSLHVKSVAGTLPDNQMTNAEAPCADGDIWAEATNVSFSHAIFSQAGSTSKR